MFVFNAGIQHMGGSREIGFGKTAVVDCRKMRIEYQKHVTETKMVI